MGTGRVMKSRECRRAKPVCVDTLMPFLYH